MAMTGGTARLVKSEYANYGNASWKVDLYVYYKTTQDVAKNQSTVSCGMYVVVPSGATIGPWYRSSDSYVGTTGHTFNGEVPNFSGTRWLAENKSFTVNHNPDGTGKATIHWKWGVNSPWGRYVNPSGSFEITLPAIPRASTPSLSASTVQMGNNLKISISRASSSFTHTLKYTINGVSGTIATGVGTEYTWTIPKTLVQHIPNKTSATVTITCTTDGVGSKTVSFTATVPSASTPTLNIKSVQMGGKVTISTNREVSYYTHTLKYTLNGTTGIIYEGVTASYAWTVPDLVSLIPNATSGVATISCITYNGTAIVGTKTVTLTINAFPATTPTWSGEARMGQPFDISTEGKSAIYTHDITYSIGKASGTVETGTHLGTRWRIPMSLATEVLNSVTGKVSITCVTKNGTAVIGTVKKELTVYVPYETSPALGNLDIKFGDKITVSLPKRSPHYTHILTYSLGTKSLGPYSSESESHDFEIPLIWAAEIPDVTSGILSITCVTKNGTATVGTSTSTFKVKVPDNDETRPKFTMSFKPVHSLASAFDNVFVQGKSKVEVTFDASSEYANISAYAFSVDGITKGGNPATSEIITSSGDIKVTGVVVDSRGYSRTIEETILVASYSAPRLAPTSGNHAVVCTRAHSDGIIATTGEYVLIQAKPNISECFSHNKCKIYYRYKLASAASFGGWKLLSTEEINRTLDEEFIARNAYIIQLRIVDDVGEEKVYTYAIPDIAIPLHLGRGGKNAAVGQYCDYSHTEAFDIGWKTYFNGGVGNKVIFVDTSMNATGWQAGTAVDTKYPDADVSSVSHYTLFVAVVFASNQALPILCVKSGKHIVGSFDTYKIHMEYTESSNTLLLSEASNGMMFTGLYGLL